MLYPYQLIRSKRRTLALVINRDGELEARAPMKMPLDVIEAFIMRKQNWIKTKMEQVRQSKVKPRLYLAGERFLYLGREYELMFSDDLRLPVELNDKLCLASRHQHRAKKVLLEWFNQEAYNYIIHRVEFYAIVIGCTPKLIKISHAMQRWGSCSIKGRVNFSWRLIMAPPGIIDYVVVHELVHLKQHDHSKAFWQKVEAILPDYKERRKWLKTNGVSLVL